MYSTLTTTKTQQIAGGLLGLLVGDALGVPYEFHPPQDIPQPKEINYEPPASFDRAHKGIVPATWSDDGAQALCLLASLLERRKLDLVDFAQKLLDWNDEGYMAVDALVFDVGITTSHALQRLRQGVCPEVAGSNEQYSNGNGSLMRVLPLALWHQGNDEELVHDAQRQSCLTHRHLRSQLCCALYSLFARYILNKQASPWLNATTTLFQIYQHNETATQELEFYIRPYEEIAPQGSGYVVDSLRAARYAFEHIPTYEQAVRYAIALGHDTDTTACIVGGIIGLRDHIHQIPTQWVADLRGPELYMPLLTQLLNLYQ